MSNLGQIKEKLVDLEAQSAERREAPVPEHIDLRDCEWMPLDVRRLRDSGIAARASGEGFRAAVLLWCASWHQVPAATLPDDDAELAMLAGYGRDVAGWRAVRDEALRGWIATGDGQLYHPVIAEKAIEAWEWRHKSADDADKRSAAGRKAAAARWSKRRQDDHAPAAPAEPDRDDRASDSDANAPVPHTPSDASASDALSVRITDASDRNADASASQVQAQEGRRCDLMPNRTGPDRTGPNLTGPDLARSGDGRAPVVQDHSRSPPDRLRSMVLQAFASRSPDGGLTWASQPSQQDAIDRLMERAGHDDDPHDWLWRYLDAAWQLRERGRDVWRGQPWVPAVVCSPRMMPRVVEAMAKRTGEATAAASPGIAKVLKNWGRR